MVEVSWDLNIAETISFLLNLVPELLHRTRLSPIKRSIFQRLRLPGWSRSHSTGAFIEPILPSKSQPPTPPFTPYLDADSRGQGKVVFDEKNLGVYESWVETHAEVNKYKGALYRKLSSRAEAIRVSEEYVKKRPTTFFKSNDEESSCATSSSSSKEILVKLKK